MRKLVALLCVLWTVLMVWAYIYDDLALFFNSRLADQNDPEIEYYEPIREALGKLGKDLDTPIFSFPVYRYTYTVGGERFEGSDMYVAVIPPDDIHVRMILYDPYRPHVSRIEGHVEPWPYATTLLALVLLSVLMVRQKQAPGEVTRQPLKQLTVHLNQLKHEWEEAAPRVVDDRLERKALVWSNDMVVLRHRERPEDLVALARLFIIYSDRTGQSESKATDATAVFRYTGEHWEATDQLVHELPEEVRKSYPEYVVVHERVDENRNAVFAELLRRTRMTEPVKLSDNEIRNIVTKDDHDESKN